MVDGKRSFRLGTPFVVTSNGRLVPRHKIGAHTANFLGELQNEGTHLCLSSFGTHTDGAPAYQWSCSDDRNQTWYLVDDGTNGLEVVNEGDGWCLTNKGGVAADNNPQTMWPCPNGADYKELYGVAGGSGGIPIFFFPKDPNYHNNGYAVSSLGNATPGSQVYEWKADYPDASNQGWSGPLRCELC